MKKFLGALATLLTPFATFAQITVSTGPNAGNILQTIGTLLGRIIPILITLGLVYFIWGMVNYIIAKDDTKKQQGGM
ncbi:MAG: hypothetical protein LRY46_02005 [Candidatus Pacebacteria bacterium]|nr:hypothetical protein [Candidatus Paceibacterota bacterium]